MGYVKFSDAAAIDPAIIETLAFFSGWRCQPKRRFRWPMR